MTSDDFRRRTQPHAEPFEGVDGMRDYDAHSVVAFANHREKLASPSVPTGNLSGFDALGVLEEEIFEIVRDEKIDARRDTRRQHAGILDVDHRQPAGRRRQKRVKTFGAHSHQSDQRGGKVRDRLRLKFQATKNILEGANHLQGHHELHGPGLAGHVARDFDQLGGRPAWTSALGGELPADVNVDVETKAKRRLSRSRTLGQSKSPRERRSLIEDVLVRCVFRNVGQKLLIRETPGCQVEFASGDEHPEFPDDGAKRS